MSFNCSALAVASFLAVSQLTFGNLFEFECVVVFCYYYSDIFD